MRHGYHRRARLALPLATAALVLITSLALVTGQALANPATSERYPAGSSATFYSGLAFDTCTAPPLSAITAWNASPYRAVAVYIGGVDRHCTQPQLTSAWVTAVTALRWRLIPIYKGLQAPCGSSPNTINPATAASQGIAAADDAITQATTLGMIPGSAIYNDMENYPMGSASCRAAVLTFLSAWTAELHQHGFLAGVYGQLYSGAHDLAQVYGSASYARPDALWVARYDLSSGLSGWSGIPDSTWSFGQRAKQYRGGHDESYGGVTLNIDNDNVNAPVATVPLAYAVSGVSVVPARSGPARSYPVIASYRRGTSLPVSCQAPGQKIGTTAVWDKLTDGTYVPDNFVSTPSTTGYSGPLPRCTYPVQVTPGSGLSERTGPGTSYRVTGTLATGALARVTCQAPGQKVGTTAVWDKLLNGRWVTDLYVATLNKRSYSRPVPRC